MVEVQWSRVPDVILDELRDLIVLYGEAVGGTNQYGQPMWSEDYLYGFPESENMKLSPQQSHETPNIEFGDVRIWVKWYLTNGAITDSKRSIKEWQTWLSRVRDFVEKEKRRVAD